MRLFLPCVLYGISIISFCLLCPHYYYIFYHESCLLPDDKTYPPIRRLICVPVTEAGRRYRDRSGGSDVDERAASSLCCCLIARG